MLYFVIFLFIYHLNHYFIYLTNFQFKILSSSNNYYTHINIFNHLTSLNFTLSINLSRILSPLIALSYLLFIHSNHQTIIQKQIIPSHTYYNLYMKHLQSGPRLIEIQTRLKKQSYLSRSTLPGSSDAKMFLFLDQIKRYPDRKVYPNLYHWYILMKQFAIPSLQKWISNGEQADEDQLIDDFISKRNQKILADAQIPKKVIQTLTDDHSKSIKTQELTAITCHQLQYVMDVKIKVQTKSNMKQLVQKFFQQQQIQSLDVQQFMQQKQRRLRIQAKMDVQKYEKLKNKISGLEGVQKFQSKKKDKRFMTGNSSTNYLPEV